MKQRIMSRADIVRTLCRLREHGKHGLSPDAFEQAQSSFAIHLLADGDTVKVYNDRDYGGTVVEIAD